MYEYIPGDPYYPFEKLTPEPSGKPPSSGKDEKKKPKRKGLIGLLVGSFLFFPTISLGYEVGDKMPDFTKMKILKEGSWYLADADTDSIIKKGKVRLLDENGDLQRDYRVAYIECNGKELQFGFYSFDDDNVYLDNVNKPLDGIIDVKTKPGGLIENDAPDCPKKLN